MAATARRNRPPYFPSFISGLAVNQVALSVLTVSRADDLSFLAYVLALIIHTTILGLLIAASVMSWMSWHGDLVAVTVTSRPKDPTEQRKFPPRGM